MSMTQARITNLRKRFPTMSACPLSPTTRAQLAWRGFTTDSEILLCFYHSTVQNLGLVCTVDLFPVYNRDGSGSRKDPGTSRRHSSASSNKTQHPSAITEYPQHQHQSFTFVPETPYDSPSAVAIHSGTVPQPRPVSETTPSQPQRPQPAPSDTLHSPTSTSPSDIVWKVGNHTVTESSKITHALVGATFVQPATVDYQGRKSLMFVFAVSNRCRVLLYSALIIDIQQDLAVKLQGTFILRYRLFDLFAKADNVHDLAIQAECYGGTFRVYSNKEFPGLQASTELTKVRMASNRPSNISLNHPFITAACSMGRTPQYSRDRTQTSEERRAEIRQPSLPIYETERTCTPRPPAFRRSTRRQ